MKIKLCAFLIVALAVVQLAEAQDYFVTNIIDLSGYNSTVSLAVDNNNTPLLVYRKTPTIAK